MRIPPVSPFLAVFFWACTVGSSEDRASSRSRQSTVGECSLSPAEQTEAVKRFDALMPVIQHPRCVNCHGGIDFFSAGYEDLHGGGAVEMVDREVKGPDGSIIAHRRPDFATCASCHDAQTRRRWEIPAPMLNVNFAGRTAAQICEQMKRHSQNPGTLILHIEKDELIRLGFEGRRGFTSLSRLPPPMTAEGFNAKVAAWVESMKTEEEWPEPLSCGCVPKGWNGIITYSEIDDLTKRREYGLTGSRRAQATIRIVTEGKGSWQGTFTGSSERKRPPCHHQGTEQYSGNGPAVLAVLGSNEPGAQAPLEGDAIRIDLNIQPDGSYSLNFSLSPLEGSTRGVSTGPPGECEVFDETEKEPISISTGVQSKGTPNADRLSGTNTEPIMIGNRRTGQRVLTWNLARGATR